MADKPTKPAPGFYRMRRVRGGVYVPVLVFRPCPMDPEFGYPQDRWYHLQCWIDGWGADNLQEIWPYLRPISEAEYCFLMKLHGWARRHAPELPEANTFEPADLDKMSPIF